VKVSSSRSLTAFKEALAVYPSVAEQYMGTFTAVFLRGHMQKSGEVVRFIDLDRQRTPGELHCLLGVQEAEQLLGLPVVIEDQILQFIVKCLLKATSDMGTQKCCVALDQKGLICD
jgi:hypothetical protein